MADEIATIISSLGLSNEAFLAIVLLAFVVIGAIIVIVATRPILDVYPYLHPNARVRARKGRLFDEKQISEIVETNNIEDRIRDWFVELPVKGFLFPAFNDRASDVHNILYYSKKPEELLDLITLMCKKDGTFGGRLAIYDELRTAALDTKLFDYNVGAFADLLTYLRNNQSALVYICTGGGKTTTALEYLRLRGGKALVLGPGDTIKSGWEDARNWENLGATADVVNYQTFMNDYHTRDLSKYSVIICDEAHHLQAERWGAGVVKALRETNIKIIGLTATPTPEQFDGTDNIFYGRLCCGLDLAEGIENGNIHKFGYIQSIYRMEDVKSDFDKHGDAGTLLWEKLNLKANENPIDEIITDMDLLF